MVCNIWLLPPWYLSSLQYFANKLTRGTFQWIFISQRDSAIWLQSVCNLLQESFGSGRIQFRVSAISAGTVLSGFYFRKPIIALGCLQCCALESQGSSLLESTVWILLQSKLHQASKAYLEMKKYRAVTQQRFSGVPIAMFGVAGTTCVCFSSHCHLSWWFGEEMQTNVGDISANLTHQASAAEDFPQPTFFSTSLNVCSGLLDGSWWEITKYFSLSWVKNNPTFNIEIMDLDETWWKEVRKKEQVFCWVLFLFLFFFATRTSNHFSYSFSPRWLLISLLISPDIYSLVQ